jgi:hypothetical protein
MSVTRLGPESDRYREGLTPGDLLAIGYALVARKGMLKNETRLER